MSAIGGDAGKAHLGGCSEKLLQLRNCAQLAHGSLYQPQRRPAPAGYEEGRVMARISKCDKLTEHERLRLVGRIGEGASWDTLATEFSIPSASIREWAGRNGYGRSPTASKRKMVEDLLTRPETAQIADQTAPQAVSTGNTDVDEAAREDVRDMRLGLQAARLALKVSAGR
jgi:hypothetical protein